MIAQEGTAHVVGFPASMSDVVRGAISESIMSNSSSIINGDPPGTHGDRSKSKSMFVRIR